MVRQRAQYGSVKANAKCLTNRIGRNEIGHDILWPLEACRGGFSLSGIKVQSTQMEEDVGLETLFVPIPKGLFDQPLDFIV